MELYNVAVYFGTLILESLLLWRAYQQRLLKQFPFFYSYLLYDLCCASAVYSVHWIRPNLYSTAFWLYYLIGMIVEFAVLLEISEHIFQPFPVIRHLGQAVTILITVTFVLVYILPALLESHQRSAALLQFTIRASLTKAVILGAILIIVRHYGLKLGRNVGGLIVGFSIYLGVNIVDFGAAATYGRELYAKVLWALGPTSFALCLIVWTIALWEFAPNPQVRSTPMLAEGKSQTPAVEIARLNSALSRFLNK